MSNEKRVIRCIIYANKLYYKTKKRYQFNFMPINKKKVWFTYSIPLMARDHLKYYFLILLFKVLEDKCV